ncbi:2-methylthioadenine synthetase [Candidatus Scalindua japonica]|uniref:2-methylthioadenine synthetase n=1 Tax=Candidatus Scalindua japonica TaxID=1284222 RepID=A0A286TVX5_9BACT|nr:hypothetical protein [Candidatus Scalindua japonica]GAX60029.1 2-methylthioadenine synthetase [Candidatus Scalindua japonica]
MIRQQLVLIGLKSSIYIAVTVFFLSCMIGYASNLAIETLMQKALIAGCLTGLTAFVLVIMLVKYVPNNIDMINDENSKDNKEQGK